MSIVRPDDMERITTPELAKKFIDEQIVKIKEQVRYFSHFQVVLTHQL